MLSGQANDDPIIQNGNLASRHMQFSKSRVQIQRVSDARFFGGWIESFDGSILKMKVETEAKIVLGDTFSVRAYGTDRDAVFMATVMHCGFTGSRFDEESLQSKVLTLTMQATGKVEQLNPNEPARFAAPELKATVRLPFREFALPVSDISADGLGLISPVKFAANQTLDLEVASSASVLRFAAQVRYCRKLKGSSDLYRVGVQLEELPNPASGDWRQMVAQAA